MLGHADHTASTQQRELGKADQELVNPGITTVGDAVGNGDDLPDTGDKLVVE